MIRRRASAVGAFVVSVTLAGQALAQQAGGGPATTATAPAGASAASAASQAPAATPPASTASTPSTASTDSTASTAAQDEARARYKRALELVDDGDFDAALLELQRAYELAPSYRILYNTGLVSQQLKQYARAYDAFERYLREGGAEIPADRVAEVTHRLDRLKERVAYLTVQSDPTGADVSIDDVPSGRTPFATPLRVNSGRRKVTVQGGGRTTESRIVELAGGEQKSVMFDSTNGFRAAPNRSTSVVPYVAWGTTGLLVAGAVTTGILALTSTNSYDHTVDSPNASASDIGSAWSKAHSFALATDILGAAAIVGAGVSLYFTIKPPKGRQDTAADLVVFPGGAFGRF